MLGLILTVFLGVQDPCISAIAWFPDGTRAAITSPAGLLIQESKQRKKLATEIKHPLAVRFSSDGRNFAVAGGVPGESGAIEIWNAEGLTRLHIWEVDNDTIADLAWIRDDKVLAAACRDGAVRLLDAQSGMLLAELRGHAGPVQCIAVCPHGKLLCSGGVDQAIRVWDLETRKLLRTLDQHRGAVHQIAFRMNVDEVPLLASVSEDKTLRIWQPSIGRMVRFIPHPVAVLQVRWTHEGDIITSSKDGVLRHIDGDSTAIKQESKKCSNWLTALAVHPKNGDVLVGDALGKVHAAPHRANK